MTTNEHREGNLMHIGLDVDDKCFHGFAVSVDTIEGRQFKSRPAVSQLIKEIERLQVPKECVKICYESGHLSYSLQRELSQKGYHCDIVATSMIPRVHGQRVKTDRVDAKKLAKYYQKGELTLVHVPDETEESIRNLIRSRNFLKNQSKALKTHILFLCRATGLHYRGGEKSKKSYWTIEHIKWLEKYKNAHKEEAFNFNVAQLLNQLEQVNSNILSYDKEIERLAKSAQYEKRVDALRCYRGIDYLSAMTLITEIGDVRRFAHPKRLCSYVGFDIAEYSSGGKERKYGITKLGNRRIRTTIVESSQQSWNPPYISKRLKQVHRGAESKVVEISDRCMKRLYSKSKRLLMRGKEKNKVVVACAREKLCFIWESLQAVAV